MAGAVDPDPAEYGLARLSGGMTHDVLVPVDDPNLVVKVFQAAERDGPKHEWGRPPAHRLGGQRLQPPGA